MPRARLLLLPLLGLSLLAAKAVASGPEAAITRAAVAPFQDALRHDAAALCADFVPEVAAELVEGSAAAGGCTAAASGEFALTAPNEPPADPGLSLQPTVQDLEVAGQHATLKLSFIFETVTKKRGTTVVGIHPAGPFKLDLEEVGGAWLVSSRARLATVPGCYLPKPRRCPRGARVLSFSVGEFEPAQPGLELPSPVVPAREGRRKREVEAGRLDVARSGCLACHRIGDNGNRRPGENLTHVGSKLSERELVHALVDPRAPMPSFRHLPAQKLDDIVRFLAALRCSPQSRRGHTPAAKVRRESP
jgi:mono/diheme cytochrome c family protein